MFVCLAPVAIFEGMCARQATKNSAAKMYLQAKNDLPSKTDSFYEVFDYRIL
jgi:hypothetical protein